MHKTLKIKKTESSPEVIFNPKKNVFIIRGRCLEDNPTEFYQILTDWLIKYSQEPNKLTELTLDLDYYNSVAARKIVQFLKTLEQIHCEENQVKVFWLYQSEDVSMLKKGKELQKMFNMNFEIKSY